MAGERLTRNTEARAHPAQHLTPVATASDQSRAPELLQARPQLRCRLGMGLQERLHALVGSFETLDELDEEGIEGFSAHSKTG